MSYTKALTRQFGICAFVGVLAVGPWGFAIPGKKPGLGESPEWM
jgi:hypothetical protein